MQIVQTKFITKWTKITKWSHKSNFLYRKDVYSLMNHLNNHFTNNLGLNSSLIMIDIHIIVQTKHQTPFLPLAERKWKQNLL